MKPINEIYAEFLLKQIIFHKKIETDLYRDALMFHSDKKYGTSAILCAVLYEMIFTTRYIRETSLPGDFIPSKDNLEQQLKYLIDREEEVINDLKLSFRDITKGLVETTVLTAEEKEDYDKFYTYYRNPILHGLTFRLFEPMLGRPPVNSFEVDVKYDAIFLKLSEIMINKIYEIMAIKKLLKK